MFDRPLISVIIPALNAAATLPSTLASLRAQTWQDWEAVVVVDGRSHDRTAEIAAQCPDPRIRVTTVDRPGPSAARNRGLELIQGAWVAFLDADDWWLPEKLITQLEAVRCQPEAAMAYSWTDYVDERNELLFPGCHASFSGQVYAPLLANNFIENGSNPLVRRTALVNVGGFDPALTHAEDWDLWLRVAERYPVVAVPVAQVRYRVAAGSLSANLQLLEQGCNQVLDQHLARHPELRALGQAARSRFYQGLACKALTSGPPTRNRGRRSARLLAKAVRHRPSLLRDNTQLVGVLAAKSAAIALLGPQRAERLQSWLGGEREHSRDFGVAGAHAVRPGQNDQPER